MEPVHSPSSRAKLQTAADDKEEGVQNFSVQTAQIVQCMDPLQPDKRQCFLVVAPPCHKQRSPVCSTSRSLHHAFFRRMISRFRRPCEIDKNTKMQIRNCIVSLKQPVCELVFTKPPWQASLSGEIARSCSSRALKSAQVCSCFHISHSTGHWDLQQCFPFFAATFCFILVEHVQCYRLE